MKAVLALVLACFPLAGQAEEISVLAFNTWVGGSAISGGQAKVVEAIEASGADVVLLQEAAAGIGSLVASELGWYSYVTGDDDVLSRYPIVHTHQATQAVIAEVELTNGSIVAMVSVHLSASPYGPYAACLDGDSDTEVIATENGRVAEMAAILDSLEFYRDTDTPVLMGGDFNAPSHLDWTAAVSDLHCGYAIEWPVSRAVEDAGFDDAYRSIYADPRTHPSNTWSPIYLDYLYSDGKPEPLDRIDYIYYAGSSVALLEADEFLIGVPEQSPNHVNNDWPSDHAAVRAVFSVPAGVGSSMQASNVDLTAAQAVYGTGEPLEMNFSGGPGNSRDWIGIYPAGGNTPGNGASTAWLYVNGFQVSGAAGIENGSLVFDSDASWTWPLAEGDYHVFFLEDDGYDILAGPVSFSISDVAVELSVSRSIVLPEEDIELSFRGGPGNAADWIGIYPVGGNTPGSGGSTDWLYVGGSQFPVGGVSEGVLNFANPGTGEWAAYFLENDGFDVLAGPIFFEVTLSGASDVPSLLPGPVFALLVLILGSGVRWLRVS